jgi:hypothetical protein
MERGNLLSPRVSLTGLRKDDAVVNFLGRFAARRRRLARLDKGDWRSDGDSEAAALCGAPYGECSSARVNICNLLDFTVAVRGVLA